MSSGNDFDDFSDMVEGGGGGILTSQGLDDFEGMQTKLVGERTDSRGQRLPSGVSVVMNCRLCNKKQEIILEWPEVIVVANQPGVPPIMPPNWKYSQQNKSAYLPMGCNCGGRESYSIHMMPAEAQQHVQNGLKAGLVPLQLVQYHQQQVARARGR